MPSNLQTTVPIFILIVIGYIAFAFFAGAKKAFFEPWQSSSDDPEVNPSGTTAKTGAAGTGDSPGTSSSGPEA